MRTSHLAVLLFLCSLIPESLSAQQSAPTATTSGPQTPQAASVIQQSIAAMTGGATVTDVTLTGTVTLTTGTSTESGTAVFVATASGQSLGTLTMPSGIHTNLRDYTTTPRTGLMTLPGGSPQPEPAEDLTGPHPAWFYPAFIMQSSLASSFLSTVVGTEVRDGASVQHVAIWPLGPAAARLTSGQILAQRIAAPPGAPQRAGQYDFYLDPSSLLPVGLTVNLRAMTPPVNGVSLPATVPALHEALYFQEEFRFSEYEQVQGQLIPFHIHQATGNGISMDIQISSVKFNTGVTIAAN